MLDLFPAVAQRGMSLQLSYRDSFVGDISIENDSDLQVVHVGNNTSTHNKSLCILLSVLCAPSVKRARRSSAPYTAKRRSARCTLKELVLEAVAIGVRVNAQDHKQSLQR